MTEITKNTTIQIGLVVTLMAAAYFIIGTRFVANEATEKITKVESRVEYLQSRNSDIEARLTRLETVLERIDKRTEVLDNISKILID